jgi:hypothetical protein
MRQTYKIMNKPLTIMMFDRGLFLSSLTIGSAFLMSLNSFVAGIAAFSALLGLAYMKAKDPVGMLIRFKPPTPSHYDPALRQPFVVITAGRKQNEYN